MPLIVWVYLHSNFSGGLRNTSLFQECVSAVQSSKVINFGTKWKHVCDFLLVRHCNFGPILHCFKGIASFCAPHPYSTLIFGVFSFDQIADIGVTPSMYLKLISRKIIFEAL